MLITPSNVGAKYKSGDAWLTSYFVCCLPWNTACGPGKYGSVSVRLLACCVEVRISLLLPSRAARVPVVLMCGHLLSVWFMAYFVLLVLLLSFSSVERCGERYHPVHSRGALEGYLRVLRHVVAAAARGDCRPGLHRGRQPPDGA